MKSIYFKFEKIRIMMERIGRSGKGQHILVFILIAVVVLFSSADLAHKIAKASETVSRPGKAALMPVAEAKSIEKKPPEIYQNIVSRNLFGSTDKESAGVMGKDASSPEQMDQTTLQLDLLGTVAGSDSYSRAIIDDKQGKKPRVYKTGDLVGNATITKIMRNSVLLRVGEREEVLTMKTHPNMPGNRAGMERAAPGLPPRAVEPGPRTPPGAAGPGTGREVKDFIGQANIRPHFEGGKMDGFYLGQVEEGSMLKRFGLETGDVLEGVNNQSFQKPEDINYFQNIKLAQGQKNTLKIKRQGKSITLNLD
jgi:type II secretion system protein C